MARTHQEPPKVRFYQLAAMPLERALVGIVGKAWDRGLSVCLLANDAHHAQWLDELLWRFPHDGFLPHGQWKNPDPERQPILISLEPDARNGATVIVLASPKLLADPKQFDLVIDFVYNQNLASQNESRRRYSHYRKMGCQMEYWTQTPQGGWQKKRDVSPKESSVGLSVEKTS